MIVISGAAPDFKGFQSCSRLFKIVQASGGSPHHLYFLRPAQTSRTKRLILHTPSHPVYEIILSLRSRRAPVAERLFPG
jgi:hypothetical protein